MKSCILTVIKNEHEYLDEWITYHLDLGIDHLFIFEDIDSDSHKEICDKYVDKVTLGSVLNVLNDAQKQEAKELKQTKKWNAQHLYFRNTINYIKQLSKYDWCFIIDNDEFITLENNSDKFNDVLDLYKDYDAVIMQWKCYGANGLINKPDYTNKGVIDIYTKEISGRLPDRLDSLVKTCYNLNTYNSSFFYNQHHPNNNCNWCNTDFRKTIGVPCFNNIYIRHYITKSWEEYVWKRKTRGFMWGGTRGLDVFFQINSDMVYIKEELINKLKEETLVVLPYKQGGSQGNEIRICLNAWRKFCQFNYHLVVIGEFNETLKNEFPWVEFIYCPSAPKKPNQYNPHLDIQNKFKIISRMYSQIYDGFIYLTDDEYAIKPFELTDITKIYCHSFSFTGDKNAPTSYWNYDKWKTRQLLDRYNLPHINYTTHYPCWFDFKKFEEIRKKFNMLEESYVFDDVYFNYFEHEEPVLDTTIRLGIWNYGIYKNEFQKAVENPNIKFMCNSVEGWSKDLEESLWKILK